MSSFEKFILFLQGSMDRPSPYGWFHLMWIGITIICIILVCLFRNKSSSRQLKVILLVYGGIAFVLELLKQISWAFNYDPIINLVIWDYEWYSFPFQLCTTPIYVSLLYLFIKKDKIKKALLSYMAFITILGGFVTILIPDSCFTSDILINIHTMWLHCGSFVVSIYLLVSGHVKLCKENFVNAVYVFLLFVCIALFLNIIIYNIGILNGETFNMFFISPYFESTLPVFDVIQRYVPYILYLFIYIIVIILGGSLVYFISYLIRKICYRCKNKLVV